MGQDLSSHQPELALKPGTYRIYSKLTNTAIQVSDHDHGKIVTWEKHDRRNQQWFVQPSGDGYRFKNCERGTFLTIPSTVTHTLVETTRFPTTWVLLSKNDGYMIQYPRNNHVLDLHFGWGNNGNEIHIWPPGGDNVNKVWMFEYLSGDCGEELPLAFRQQADELTRDLSAETQNSALKDQRIASLELEVSDKRRGIEERGHKLEDFSRQLAEKDASIRQLQQTVLEKEQALLQARQAYEELSQLRKQHSLLQDDMSKQQTETASLQGKMDRVEYLLARMSQSHDT